MQHIRNREPRRADDIQCEQQHPRTKSLLVPSVIDMRSIESYYLLFILLFIQLPYGDLPTFQHMGLYRWSE